MTATDHALPRVPAEKGPALRLLRAEFLKIRTTHTWWILALGTLLWTAIALAFNMWFAYLAFSEPEMLGQEAGSFSPEYHAGNIYTSGQYLGLLFVMLLGILVVTNEFFHKTATATFLVTPHRTSVIMNKLLMVIIVAVTFWAVTTAIDLVAGGVFLQSQDQGSMLGESAVQRVILLNLVAFAVWGVFGVAIGTLITNQLASTILATVLYVVGTQLAGLAFLLLANLVNNDTVQEFQVIVPSIASQAMTTGGANVPGQPEWWVGALVLLGYTVLAGAAGILITRRRDIS